MRSALDHLAWQLYLHNGSMGKDNNVYFPIADDATAYVNKLKSCSFRVDALAILAKLQPYTGGADELLWLLHKLNNIDKHRLIVTVGSAYTGFNAGKQLIAHLQEACSYPLPKIDFYLQPEDNLFPLEKGKELYSEPVDIKEMPIDFRFNIVISEKGLIDGISLLQILNDFHQAVNSTVKLFEPCLT